MRHFETNSTIKLCHENGVKFVSVNEVTANAIKGIAFGALVWMGVKFKVK